MKRSLIEGINPITFEILSHRLFQVTKEMGITIERVGGTVNTTQMHDYMAALYMPAGEILCAGESMGWHVACAGFAVKALIERFGKEGGIYPDDIFLLNDPYVAAIHQSDVYVICPIHYRDKLMGWSGTFVHVADIGAMSPGGNSPGATEVYHEGLRIPGVKLVERGKLRRDVFETFLNMTRQPGMVGLDLKCEIAANNVAKARMRELYGQYGPELVSKVSLEMIRYSEQVLRNRLEEIPDGQWQESYTMQDNESRRIVLTLKKRGNHLVFDFTGTDPQSRRGINIPYHGTFGACFESLMGCMCYDLPKNHGLFRCLEVSAPRGTVVNPELPAPVSMSTTSSGAVLKYCLAKSVIVQMLAQSEKWKKETMAVIAGQQTIMHAGFNQYRRYYATPAPDVCGNGARSYMDGVDSGDRITATNAEWAELNFPLLHLFRRHVTDGGGAGKYRGGVGVETLFTIHDAPQGKLKGVSYGVAGPANSGRGIFGGYPGAPSVVRLVEGSEVEGLFAAQRLPGSLEELGGKSRLLSYGECEIDKGTVVYRRAASGGGYGDPLERDMELVARDIEEGIISAAAAGEVYGAVLDQTGKLDPDATRERRNSIRKERMS
jgi:N-methylhydantoinase B